MTIQHHLARTVGTELSHDTISKITDAVLEEVKAWQSRRLDPIYPIVYLDALVVKVRAGAHVRNKAAHIAVGVDCDGVKHVLGIWVQTSEGAKFWAGVCAELRNRGLADVLILCCDGLTGLPEAVAATWAHTVVQTCTVHLIRAAMRFVSYNDRKALAAALRPIYTAPTAKPPRRHCWPWPTPSSAAATPARSGSGRTPGSGSSRFWPSHPRSAGSSTPPTPSRASITNSERSSRTGAISRATTP